MTYPYGTKGAPVVGNGLGGLPRRALPPPPPAPVVVPEPISPYYISKRDLNHSPSQTLAYSPHLVATQEFSDGNFSGNMFYNAHVGTLNYSERTLRGSMKQIMSTGGNATVWRISPTTDGYRYTYCLKNDLSGMVVLDTQSDSRAEDRANTGCFETVNGVDTYYFLDGDGSTMILSRVIPNYAAQTARQSANTVLSFAMNGVSRRPYAIFVRGEFLYIVSGNTSTSRMHLDVFNKSDLTFVSTRFWNVSTTPASPERGFIAETATTIAIRYASAGSFTARVFILDKTTLLGRDYTDGFGGDASPQCNLISDGQEIYVVTGYGSGGSFGYTSIKILRPNATIDVATQSFSGATFSLASSVSCPVPRGFSWGTQYVPLSGSQTSDQVMVFVPSSTRSFSYSNSGWSFSQHWTVSAATPIEGTATTSTPSLTTNPYSPVFWSYNPLGTNYIAP